MSLIDDLGVWLASGPGAPLFAQLFSTAHAPLKEFGSPESGLPPRTFGGLQVHLNADEDLRAPSNGLLWRVPDVNTLTDDEKKAFRAAWPVLRSTDGLLFGPDNFVQPGDLLLEVWGGAHRRYEYLWLALDYSAPESTASEQHPQMPVPRWFWIRGVDAAANDTAVTAIVTAQFVGGMFPIPTLTEFGKGQSPIYVQCNDALGHVAAAQSVTVRVFDGAGLPVDPSFVFAQFARLASEGFGRLARPDETTVANWKTAWATVTPPRQTLVFSDHVGRPYVPWEDIDPPPHPPETPIPAPERTLFIEEKDIEADIPEHGVVVFPKGSAEHTSLEDEVVELTIAGIHTRVGLHPHGKLGANLSAGFAEWAFFRVQVIDYALWFPRNANDRNQMQRYSEGNHLQFLIDGQSTFREIYRDIRATHRDEEYLRDDDMPEGIARPANEVAGTQVLAINCWISPGHPLLGRRSMLVTPRMQNGPRPPEDLPGRLTARPMFEFPGDPATRVSSQDGLQRLYCLLIPPGTLQPGTFVEIRQLQFSSRFTADDPRIVGEDSGADMFGRIAPMHDASSWTFAGPSGGCVLRPVFDPDWDGEALLRAVTWEPDDDDPGPLDTFTSGRGRMRIWAYGTVDLPTAPGGLTPPAPDGVDPAVPAQLLWDGTLGHATVVIPAGLVTSAGLSAVVVNQRTGEGVSVPVPAGTTVEIPLLQFARDDSALLGFTTANPVTVADCPGFFELHSSDGQKAAGAAPLHPKEAGGTLREAIQAGVDVRLLAWNDQFDPGNLERDSLGMTHVLNPVIDGRRGQAMLDRIGRETGVHHQKSTFIRTPEGAVAFLGGIDLRRGRFDEPTHPDPSPDRPTGLWHDLHCRVVGRAVWDIYRNFQERWNIAVTRPDLQPVPAHATTVPPPTETEILASPSDGPVAVQINRTIPPYVDAYTPIVDLDRGDQSIRQAYLRTMNLARRFLYIEDQYLWDPAMAHKIRERLTAAGGIDWAILILPRQLSEFPVLDLVFYAIRRRNINIILNGVETIPEGEDPAAMPGYVGDRVVIAHPVTNSGVPVYVHAKGMIADDLWMSIGSSNLSRRSMSVDSEINAASIDSRIRRGTPLTAREFRVALMADHLRLLPEERALVDDPREGFRLFKATLAGERPWARVGITAYDPNHTQYGIEPPGFDPHFPEALAAGMDPDGNDPSGIRLVDFLSLRQTFATAATPADLGNLTAVRVHADIAALPPPADPADPYVWTVVLTGPQPPSPRTTGPLPVTQDATLGVVSSSVTWHVAGAVALASAPGTPIATAEVDVTPSSLVTNVTLVFV
ncbi:MAG TPA: phospholipase D-like domain-containing protein [Thermoanaerobaculia bacterium]|nr:phospholipase D-like domain-containing protein [Thermoanaerobaculia bacterium]